MIFYLHKKTGQVISKESLMTYNKNETIKLGFCKMNYESFRHKGAVCENTIYEYGVKEIPFSEDFEEIVSIFSKVELYEMLSALQSGMRNNEGACDKIRKMIEEKYNLEIKGVFLDV